ncbi:MAG: low molecular weight phosphotyrosine protein phosphatase [Tidjanibacter sp.]|nr:low molecular weight phosphotyrosine protein phosphatase [Tidjanibacter sp.]
MKKILFVCLGNICRSSAADEIMRQQVLSAGLGAEFEIDSAGTYGGHAGDLPDPRMRAAGKRRGYNFTHRSRKVRSEDFERFDLLLAMDDSVYESLSRLAPTVDSLQKLERMADYIPRHFGYDYVPDPYYEGAEGFELVLDMLEEGCRELLEELRIEN